MSLLLQQVAVVAALAIGQTLVILTAGIDLSVGAVTILVDDGHGHARRRERRPGVLALLIGVALAAGCRGSSTGSWSPGSSCHRSSSPSARSAIFTAIALLYSGGASIQDNRLPGILNFDR